MNRNIVLGAISAVAVFAGVLYFAGDFRDETPVKAPPVKTENIKLEPVISAAPPPAVSKSATASRPATSDPRLAALMTSPDNGLIDFYTDSEGRVIKEIDNDPGSPGFGRSLREYTYAGDRVIRLVVYRYLGDQVQTVTADVTYKADGGVDRYEEKTRHEFGKAGNPR